MLRDLIKQAELRGEDGVLDELVHETAQALGLDKLNALANDAEQTMHISGIEIAASHINNGGYECQIEFLLQSGVEPNTIRSYLME